MTNLIETGNPEDTNIWSSILQQVQETQAKKLPSNRTLIVLGDNETGKSTLISKLANNDSSESRGAGLEYNFLNIRDEYRDESTKLGVWILDGNLTYTSLLKFAVSDSNLENSCCLLVASMDEPWNIMNSLEKWAEVLEKRIEDLGLKEAKLKQLKQKLALKFMNYVQPTDETEARLVANKTIDSKINDLSSANNNNSTSIEGLESSGLDVTHDAELYGDALKKNLGIQVIVVITKTDQMSNLEKEYDYTEETFDFVQQAVRKFCLNYGAALFYVSTKTNTNCELLHKYLAHCIYDLPFKSPASVIAKESIFVPAGWDNMKKIEILYDNIRSVHPDEYYNNYIIVPEKPQQVSGESEVYAEDDHSFFARLHHETLQRRPENESPNQSMQNAPSPNQQRQDPNVANDAQNQSEGVLQNFFYSLLSNPQNAINR